MNTFAAPNWTALTLLFSLSISVLLIITLIQGRTARVPQAAGVGLRRGEWLKVIGLSTVVLLTLGVFVIGIKFYRSAKVEVATRTISSSPFDSHVAVNFPDATQFPVPPPVEPQFLDFDHREIPLFSASIDRTIVGLGVLLLVGLLTVASIVAQSWTAGTAQNRRPQPARSGAGWLVVPGACLLTLGCLVTSTLSPRRDAQFNSTPVITRTIQERMDKAVRDLIENTSRPTADAQQIPDWIKQKPQGPHEYLLSSGPYSTREEAEDELLPFAANLLQRAFHQYHSWQGAWKVPLAQVRERVADHQFVERLNVTSGEKNFEMYRVHMRVNVAPEICDLFIDSWKSQIVERRLLTIGVLLAWLTVILMQASRYYTALATAGQTGRWARTLKASVTTVGATALAAWAFVTYIH